MIYHGFKVSTSPATAVPLSSVSRKASFVTIYPRVNAGASNAGEVRLGGNPALAENGTPSAAIASGRGIPLNPGDAAVLWVMPTYFPLDLKDIYLDVDNSGDGVQFVYGRP